MRAVIHPFHLVRDYHRSYYVPHNLSLIVAGKLSSGTSMLLSVIQNKVEPSLIAHGQNMGPRPSGWKRPFVETPSAIRAPIAKTLTKTVEFPEKDESMGELIINFMGPPREHYLERKVQSFCFYVLLSKRSCDRVVGTRCAWCLHDFIGGGSFKQGIHRDRVTSLVCII
jgi:Zn-dependent M16 (insulinase) family peptidase